jgi:hypothetical protein
MFTLRIIQNTQMRNARFTIVKGGDTYICHWDLKVNYYNCSPQIFSMFHNCCYYERTIIFIRNTEASNSLVNCNFLSCLVVHSFTPVPTWLASLRI